MSKKEITVGLETITPLWTGDGWQDNTKIRPSSLMGSLRFWFEVICYFSGVTSKIDFNSKTGRFEKEVNKDELNELKKKLKSNGTDVKSQIEILLEMNISLPSIIFGATGWRSLIEIKEIKPLCDYCFGNRLNLPNRICVSKVNVNEEVEENSNCPKRSDNNWSVFYFPNPYFYGVFEVKFLVEEKILDGIFYPLLNFMDECGYWGGKWNIGYGRLKVLRIINDKDNKWQKEEFNLSNFSISKNLKISELCEEVQNKNSLKGGISIKYWKTNCKSKNNNETVRESLKNLIIEKAKLRASESNQKDRHYVFGKTGYIEGEDLPQGSKILPYINKKNNSYKCGLLSITGILNLYDGGEKDE